MLLLNVFYQGLRHISVVSQGVPKNITKKCRYDFLFPRPCFVTLLLCCFFVLFLFTVAFGVRVGAAGCHGQ